MLCPERGMSHPRVDRAEADEGGLQLGLKREATAPKGGRNAERSSAARARPQRSPEEGASDILPGGKATHNHPIG
jgi:hypothetical protein